MLHPFLLLLALAPPALAYVENPDAVLRCPSSNLVNRDVVSKFDIRIPDDFEVRVTNVEGWRSEKLVFVRLEPSGKDILLTCVYGHGATKVEARKRIPKEGFLGCLAIVGGCGIVGQNAGVPGRNHVCWLKLDPKKSHPIYNAPYSGLAFITSYLEFYEAEMMHLSEQRVDFFCFK